MPELPICQGCQKPIRKDIDDYVIPDKAVNPYDENRWTYYHADCYKPES